VKECLNCGRQAQDDAKHCPHCTKPFHYYRPLDGGSKVPSSSGGWLNPVGGILACLGLLMLAYGLFASGAPEDSETLNLGLLNDKTNMVLAGGFAFASGSVFLAAAAVINEVSRLSGIGRETSN
jgi:hypothetical protein